MCGTCVFAASVGSSLVGRAIKEGTPSGPECHAKAIKAALAEVAKHYLEESVLAKAVITYLDKMSEEPNHGA